MKPDAHAEFYREAVEEMRQLKERYREIRAVASYHKRKAGLGEIKIVFRSPGSTSAPLPISPEATRFRAFKQIDAAETVLREAGHPMKTSDIVDAMIGQGFLASDPKKLRNAVFTGMTRKPSVFEKSEAGTWQIQQTNGHAVHQ
jgi:hypothetical protein